MALVNNPSLVLADEPTGNLDTKSGDDVIKLFKEICRSRNVTIVMVTHNPDITRNCDRVIHIRDGRVEKIEVLK
jgi:putative ABC transport system ATP-binding protein